jgi:hypothetical protein
MGRWLYLIAMTVIAFVIFLDWWAFASSIGTGDGVVFAALPFFGRMIVTGLFLAFLFRRRS